MIIVPSSSSLGSFLQPTKLGIQHTAVNPLFFWQHSLTRLGDRRLCKRARSSSSSRPQPARRAEHARCFQSTSRARETGETPNIAASISASDSAPESQSPGLAESTELREGGPIECNPSQQRRETNAGRLIQNTRHVFQHRRPVSSLLALAAGHELLPADGHLLAAELALRLLLRNTREYKSKHQIGSKQRFAEKKHHVMNMNASPPPDSPNHAFCDHIISKLHDGRHILHNAGGSAQS